MAWPILVAWIHYIGIMLLLASLLGAVELCAEHQWQKEQEASHGSLLPVIFTGN